MSSRPIRIHYRRPPDRLQIFEQEVVFETDDVAVSVHAGAPLERPVMAEGAVILEPGAPVVWFSFRGEWHDIGRFHLRDGTFTGYYANILTPITRLDSPVWETTDLFLDLWLPPAGRPRILDKEEFRKAKALGWLDPETARAARIEIRRLIALHQAGLWPPPIVDAWPLERALGRLGPGG